MKTLFIAGAVVLLVLCWSVLNYPPAGGFDGRTLLGVVLAVLLVLSVPAVTA
ncbi:hypothetical protein PBI_ANDREW_52 [Arthrobacter phage Andrew]|uniref:Uncharacterized protein n=1 Tax=Arthrobacter phage Andrew TaxID=2419946 RepID=A0A3G2KCX7_9CAUD|nr:membrane protein [Arthrobacter phage Andrew]AYN56866.1 hypothetical protein PBI_ANDREW_52 [Arthrobacter phage Andrew]